MKKIAKISLILLSMMLIVTKVYAVSCNMELQSTKKNDEIVIEVAISKIETPDGIISFGGTLEYDKNSLSLEGMSGQNGWSTPSYNEKNGKFAMDRNALVNAPEKILQITFKITNPDAQSATVTLKDTIASGGVSTGDITVPNLTKTISIKEQTPGEPDDDKDDENNEQNGNNNQGNINDNTTQNTKPNTDSNDSRNIVASTTNNKANDSIKKGILPKAGTTNIVLFILGGVVILAMIFYIKMKKFDRNFK